MDDIIKGQVFILSWFPEKFLINGDGEDKSIRISLVDAARLMSEIQRSIIEEQSKTANKLRGNSNSSLQ